MPYIRPDQRYEEHFPEFGADSVGELNYQLTLVCKAYMTREGLSYGTINDIVGALESAKLEFYRRIAVPYEDEKIKENGDVY